MKNNLSVFITSALSTPVRAYQYFISPLLGNNCRFYPSCSQYSIEAIEKHGALKGGYLSIKRLLKCHPWHPGGLDPVPGKTALGDNCCCRPKLNLNNQHSGTST